MRGSCLYENLLTCVPSCLCCAAGCCDKATSGLLEGLDCSGNGNHGAISTRLPMPASLPHAASLEQAVSPSSPTRHISMLSSARYPSWIFISLTIRLSGPELNCRNVHGVIDTNALRHSIARSGEGFPPPTRLSELSRSTLVLQ